MNIFTPKWIPATLVIGLSFGIALQGCTQETPENSEQTAQVEKAEHVEHMHEESVRHMQVPEVTTAAEAKRLFIATTEAMRSKQKLDASELQEIHVITYSLEQSMAYYVKHLTGERQAIAKNLAEVVENIHIASENNRQASAKQNLATYFRVADQFMVGF